MVSDHHTTIRSEATAGRDGAAGPAEKSVWILPMDIDGKGLVITGQGGGQNFQNKLFHTRPSFLHSIVWFVGGFLLSSLELVLS